MLLLYSFIFFVVIFLSFDLSQKGVIMSKRNVLSYNFFIIIAFLLIALFIGLRYNVGRDFLSHWNDYRFLDYWDFGYKQRYNFEYGYLYVVKLAQWLPFGAQGIFLLTSFVTIVLLFLVYRNNSKFLPIGLVCFFLCGPYEFVINGIRQGIAILAFLNACSYLRDSVPWKKGLIFYVVWVLFGTLFHTSCIALIFLYPIRYISIKNKFMSNALIVAPIIAYILNITGISNLLYDFSSLETGSRFYDSYLSGDKTDLFKIASDGLNLGQFAIFSSSIIPLFYTKQIINKYEDMKCLIIIYSFGVTLSSLYIGNMMIIRSAYYFTFSLLLLYPAYTSCIRNTRLGKSSFNQVMFVLFWAWYIVQYVYTLPRFFQLHIWRDASVFGISIG